MWNVHSVKTKINPDSEMWNVQKMCESTHTRNDIGTATTGYVHIKSVQVNLLDRLFPTF